jgi:hypothetical protein
LHLNQGDLHNNHGDGDGDCDGTGDGYGDDDDDDDDDAVVMHLQLPCCFERLSACVQVLRQSFLCNARLPVCLFTQLCFTLLHRVCHKVAQSHQISASNCTTSLSSHFCSEAQQAWPASKNKKQAARRYSFGAALVHSICAIV